MAIVLYYENTNINTSPDNIVKDLLMRGNPPYGIKIGNITYLYTNNSLFSDDEGNNYTIYEILRWNFSPNHENTFFSSLKNKSKL